MADKDEKDNRQKRDRGGGGDGGSRVYIVSVEAEPGDDKHSKKLKVVLAQTRQDAKFAIPTRVLFQDKPLGVMQVMSSSTPQTFTVKPDESKPSILKIERAGYPGEKGDSFEVDLKTESHGKKTPTHEAKEQKLEQFEVHVDRVQPDGTNPVHFTTRDEHGKPMEGHIKIIAGQKMVISDREFDAGVNPECRTGNDGTATYAIEVERTGLVTFKHMESNKSARELLRAPKKGEGQ